MGHHPIRAIFSSGLLALLVIVANASMVTESPIAARSALLAGFGPGPLGYLRGQIEGVQGAKPKNMVRSARAALVVAPLAWEPFVGAAVPAFLAPGGAGDDEDVTLLREALRRNPRSEQARIMVLRNSASNNDITSAFAQLEGIRRLNGAAFEELIGQVAAGADDQAEVDEALTALAKHPGMVQAFVAGFERKPKSPEVVQYLISNLPPFALRNPATARTATNMLVRTSAFAQARQIWDRQVKSDPSSMVHSPDFSDRKAPPPFNWNLSESTSGVAEYGQKGGLSVSYYGRVPGVLANQLLVLQPGEHVAHMAYQPEGGADGAINVRIRCAETGMILAKADVAGKAGVAKSLTLPFAVPGSGCSGQFLELAGVVQEYRKAQSAVITRLTVTK
jgi:hypothetical protein